MLKDLFNCTVRPLVSVLTLGYVDPLGDNKSMNKSNYISYPPPVYTNTSEHIRSYKAHKPSLDKAIKDSSNHINNLYDIIEINDDNTSKIDNLTNEELKKLLIDTQLNWYKCHMDLLDAFKV